jgi:cell division transport system permease protein
MPETAPKSGSAAETNLVSGNGIVPTDGIAGQAFLVVIAIMAFLACLAVGAVATIANAANDWSNDISREATIQIKPFDKAQMDIAIRDASRLALTFEGIEKVTAMDEAQTAKLLEPWLGAGRDLSDLPVPRLLTITIAPGKKPDFAALRTALAEKVPGAELDDHRTWVDQLSRMAWTLVGVGSTVLALILGATALTVVFVTRGALAGNRQIVEVLHFVGAEPAFIARQFQRHFLALAARGAFFGGTLAVLLFGILSIVGSVRPASPELNQLQAMFGSYSAGPYGYLGAAAVVTAIAILAAMVSRQTVLAHIASLDAYGVRR